MCAGPILGCRRERGIAPRSRSEAAAS
ncbi:hypothetical protein CCUS01_05421 [Colletotrichum cuscutae]|uniref:Uncharacterized protein n=3 Tax=Colletotrichum acutatum species complex TaxID=2707335 RepID=A0AAI9YVY3_9PEZI|nr:hypothetical protein CCUS01_05421 [Colletotrichum cuscutae]KAK1481515.1 hypothetical protein CTAM01_13983 [Colletotrichum tamarilloi]KAK1525664.1 hypothetical protein CCOS01_08082 [Colletotrichum costaricense]